VMKKVLILIYLILVAGWVNGQYDPKARDILDKMSEKYTKLNSFRAEFTYILENEMENIQEDFSGDIIVKGDKFKLDLGDQQIYNDGETLWTYLEDVNEVNIDYYLPEDGDMTPTNIFTAYRDGYKYILVGEETIDNKINHIVDLVPDDQNKPFFKVKLWIDKKDNSLNQWKLFDKTGNTYLYDIVKFNGDYIAKDSEFVFNPADYPGVTEIDLR
jgi:outer membrane lipoprotein-sorting protein